MKSARSWRVEWAIGGLLLLPFAIARPPLHLHRHGGIAERKSHDSLSKRHNLTRNASTTFFDSRRRRESGKSSSFIKRSRRSPPSLPDNYPSRDVKRDVFPNIKPHITEPESDIDSTWSRHESGVEEEHEVELPHENHEEKLAHSPVVYQYFGRSRSRVHTADSIPFILLGPTVDHWKIVGQTLASRGFSVMACELDKRKNAKEEGKDLILAILDALRWNRAILVGCDSEAALAIEAAIQLAPDRVKGLVICGDLSSSDQLARRAADVDSQRLTKFHKQEDKKRHIALDSLLNAYLECPYTIVWDGDVSQAPKASSDSPINMNSGDMFRLNRCLILGGGAAPHRRRPEQFAWALTRFVEEKVAPRNVPLQIHAAPDNGNARGKRPAWRANVPGFVESMFSQGSMLVTGRVVASVIFYVTAMKIAVFQYDSLRGGVVSIHSLLQYLQSGRQRVFQSAGSFIKNPFIVFSLLWRRRRSNSDVGKEVAVLDNGDAQQSADEDGDKELIVTEEEDVVVEEEEQEEEKDGEDLEGEKPEVRDGDSEQKRPLYLDLVVV